MKKEGSITIYICLILVSVLLVVSVATESARIGVVHAECKTFTTMAGESVLAGYARQVFDDYGILLVWEKNPTEEEIEKSLQANVNMADLKESGTNFLKTDVTKVELLGKYHITDDGGEKFVRQVVRYIEYGGFLEEVEALIQEYKNEERNTSVDGTRVSQDIVEKESQELTKLAEELRNDLKKVKEVSTLKNQLEKVNKLFGKIKKQIQDGNRLNTKTANQLVKEMNGLQNLIKSKKEHISQSLFSMQEYVKKRNEFVRKNNLEKPGKDFVDENLEPVKNVKDKLEKIKELSVFSESDLTTENADEISILLDGMTNALAEFEKIHLEEFPENKGIIVFYQKAKKLLKDGALSLVVQDITTVSENTIPDSDLPSKIIQSKSKSAKKMQNKAIMAIYAGLQFGNYTAPKEKTCLKYEMEYIVSGNNNDKDNLLETAGKILALRNAICLAYLPTDQEKMAEIRTVSGAIAAALKSPFLETVIKGVLLEAWSLAEAIVDVKRLLDNKKVPLLKTKEDWNTELISLSGSEGKSSKGLTYLQYCRLLILAQSGQKTGNRMMDLIQMNIQKRYCSDFSMKQSIVGIHVKTSFVTRPVFLANPFRASILASNASGYEYQCEYQNEYERR